MMAALVRIATREVALTWGAGGSGFLPAAFFFGAVMIAPFAVGPDPRLLGAIGPGYLWVALALATLVSLERLFQADLEDGTLDHLVLQPVPLSLVVLAKTLGQWLAVAGPILLIVPVAAVMLKVAPAHVGGLLIQLLAGSLALFLVGTIGAALGASVRRGGLLVALIALPLYAPVLIFGSGAAEVLVKTGVLFSQPFLLVLALMLGALALVPLAAGAALRLHVD